MQEAKNSTLTIEQQKKIAMTGVDSVDAFSDAAISLTVCGRKVQIAGSGLKVSAFSQGTGSFAATGEVHWVKFGAQKGKLLQRILK